MRVCRLTYGSIRPKRASHSIGSCPVRRVLLLGSAPTGLLPFRLHGLIGCVSVEIGGSGLKFRKPLWSMEN